MNVSHPLPTRRQWCALVATLCAPGMEAAAAQSLWNMLPALQHFPEYLFTAETAQAVAMHPRRLATPAFDEISKALNAYRKEFIYEPRPAIAPPSEPPRKTPTEEELEKVRAAVLAFTAQRTAQEWLKNERPAPIHPLQLADLRRARFADLLQRGMIRPDEIPEAYRPGESRP
jgi:hypothetical protein